MAIKITFSRYCIGKDREKFFRRKCECERCLTEEGKEVTEATILSSKVNSAINKFEINQSTTRVLSKTVERAVSFTEFDIRELIRELQFCLEK